MTFDGAFHGRGVEKAVQDEVWFLALLHIVLRLFFVRRDAQKQERPGSVLTGRAEPRRLRFARHARGASFALERASQDRNLASFRGGTNTPADGATAPQGSICPATDGMEPQASSCAHTARQSQEYWASRRF